MRYALMFSDNNDVFIGPASEVVQKFYQTRNEEFDITNHKEGVYYTNVFYDNEEGYATRYCLENKAAKYNYEIAYSDFLEKYLLDNRHENKYRFFKLDTLEKAYLFKWTHDELIEKALKKLNGTINDYNNCSDYNIRCKYYDYICSIK